MDSISHILSITKPGDTVFVSYLAGRAPKEKAILESKHYTTSPPNGLGQNRRHFVGKMERVWKSKSGDTIVTIFAYNRNTITHNNTTQGGYRSFNTSLGKLLQINILESSLEN